MDIKWRDNDGGDEEGGVRDRWEEVKHTQRVHG